MNVNSFTFFLRERSCFQLTIHHWPILLSWPIPSCVTLAVVKFVSEYLIVWPRVIFRTQHTQSKIIFVGPGGDPGSTGGGRCKHEGLHRDCNAQRRDFIYD